MSDNTKVQRIIRGWSGATEFTGFKRFQVNRLIREGVLPPPMKLGGRAIGWFEGDFAQLQQTYAQNRIAVGTGKKVKAHKPVERKRLTRKVA